MEEDQKSAERSSNDLLGADFVNKWTKIVLILAVTLATLNGVQVAPIL